MSDDEKNKYKVLADIFNSDTKKKEDKTTHNSHIYSLKNITSNVLHVIPDRDGKIYHVASYNKCVFKIFM